MQTHFIEVTDYFNWGKFMLMRPDHADFDYESCVDHGRRLLVSLPKFRGERWNGSSLIVFDLQTAEGFRLNVDPDADIHAVMEKHKVWICPMAEPFLSWLYKQDLTDITTLPPVVYLEGPKQFAGYRRPGAPI